MAQQDIPFLDIYARYARLVRIFDIEPPENLHFSTFYRVCVDFEFFKEMQVLGYITVSYNENQDPIPFEPSEENGNRHQALALSTFIVSIYSKEVAKIKTPHERGGFFIATFTRLDAHTVQYVTEEGKTVKFYFDNTKPCQI